MFQEIALGLLLSAVAVFAAVWAWGRMGTAGASTEPAAGRADLQAAVGEVIIKLSTLRTEVVKDVGEFFQKTQERVEEQLARGRGEQSQSLDGVAARLEGRFQVLQETTRAELEAIRGRVESQLTAVGEKVQGKLDENIREGFKHFQDVQDSLKSAEEQLRNVGQVGQSINELNDLLKLPHLRGKFGEAEVEAIIVNFIPAHLIERNAAIEGAGRVEFLLTFPQGRLPIDSKFPREQVKGLIGSEGQGAYLEARKKFKAVIHAEAVRIEKYVQPDQGINYALMFLASEPLYFEAIRDEEICNDLYKKRVFPVSPNTLAVMLHSIQIAYGYYQMAQGLEKTMSDIEKAKKHLANFQAQFVQVGEELGKAQEAFRKAETHFDHYSGAVVRLTGMQAASPESRAGQSDALESK